MTFNTDEISQSLLLSEFRCRDVTNQELMHVLVRCPAISEQLKQENSSVRNDFDYIHKRLYSLHKRLSEPLGHTNEIPSVHFNGDEPLEH